MQKNSLLKNEDTIIRILATDENMIFFIDCKKFQMPRWADIFVFENFEPFEEDELFDGMPRDLDELTPEARRVAYQRYTMISGVLPFITDASMRSKAIIMAVEEHHISKKTLRMYICRYLAYQTIAALAPKQKNDKRALSKDEKAMRWALNKHYYNQKKNSLRVAYILMLKEKFCDGEGRLLETYPTFHQFRYFYRKSKKFQTYYISRNGLSAYQRNDRPLLGEGVRQLAPAPGVGMIDSTICDIYLVDDAGNLVGRPILTACVDAYSGLCCGYSLSWEGGVYSLRNLMLSIIEDKVQLCEHYGIVIDEKDWPAKELPGRMITDKGTEYTADTFAQITELGVTVTNLPPYRPDLKGPTEKFFDQVQETYKPYLKGKGVIEPDYAERGARDYRKDACLTLREFEKIILHCIVFYNSKRVVENFPYTEEMITESVKPYANCIFEWGRGLPGANLISIPAEQLVLTLLPRTIGTFSRFGLKVNKLRYHNPAYKERYLQGGEVVVAYNPLDVSYVWLLEKGDYVKFELIDSRFQNKRLDEVQDFKQKEKILIADALINRMQEEIELANHIEVIAQNALKKEDVNLKSIRKNRKKEQDRQRVDHVRRIRNED